MDIGVIPDVFGAAPGRLAHSVPSGDSKCCRRADLSLPDRSDSLGDMWPCAEFLPGNIPTRQPFGIGGEPEVPIFSRVPGRALQNIIERRRKREVANAGQWGTVRSRYINEGSGVSPLGRDSSSAGVWVDTTNMHPELVDIDTEATVRSKKRWVASLALLCFGGLVIAGGVFVLDLYRFQGRVSCNSVTEFESSFINDIVIEFPGGSLGPAPAPSCNSGFFYSTIWTPQSVSIAGSSNALLADGWIAPDDDVACFTRPEEGLERLRAKPHEDVIDISVSLTGPPC